MDSKQVGMVCVTLLYIAFLAFVMAVCVYFKSPWGLLLLLATPKMQYSNDEKQQKPQNIV